uniref:hypothetical protein n=1 Tax=Marinobacterium profundum TaxID=1714300 RepID=UPI000831CB79|nr:hypothetical protein [Marinobacterium profundum]
MTNTPGDGDRWNADIEDAVLRYVKAEGLPHDDPNIEILLSLFPDADWEIGALRPLSPTEQQQILQHMQTILDAPDAHSYRAAFAEAFMDMGVRFMVSTFDVLSHGDEQQLQGVLECEKILADWLFGERMTERADEDERRALVARQIVDLDDELKPMWRAAAHAMAKLPDEHPLRDVDEIRNILNACLQDSSAQQDIEREIFTRCDLVELDLADEAQCEQHLQRCFELLADFDDEESNLRLRTSHVWFSYLSHQLLAAAEAGDDGRRDRFTGRVEAALDDMRASALDQDLKMPLFALAAAYSWTLPRRSAELFAEIRGKLEKGSGCYHRLGVFEGVQWLRCDEPAHAIDALLPAMPLLEADYLSAS